MARFVYDSTKDTRKATKVAKHPGAPPDERRDANMQLVKQVMPGVNPFPLKDIVKAVTQVELQRRRNEGLPKAGAHEPLHANDMLGYRPYPGLPAAQLRQLVSEDPVLQAISLTRARQVSRLAVPRDNDRELGFRVKLRGKRRLDGDDMQKVKRLEQYMMSCGMTFDFFEREALGRDDLITYLRKSTLDSLTLDAMPIEIVRTLNGKLDGWVHVDGGTVFLCDEYGIDQNVPPPPDVLDDDLPDPEDVKAVEVIDGQIVAWFARDEILYRVRNPRPRLEHRGYGLAEPELMIRVITAFLNGMTYNSKSYQENHIPPGFLTLYGDFDEDDLEDFKAEWQAYVSGVENAFRLPVLAAKDREAGANYTTMNSAPTDMAYMKWLTFLISIQTSLYGISPEEIGFEGFSSRGASLSDGSIESKLANSQESGLHPLLQHHQSELDLMLKLVEPDAQFIWTGFEDPKEVWQRDQMVLTYGELRERQGLERSGNEVLDNAPVNSAMLTVYMQTIQQQGGDNADMGAAMGFEGENLDAVPPESDTPTDDLSNADAMDQLMQMLS